MTRWARVGSSQKHQKTPGEATTWEELSKDKKDKFGGKWSKTNEVLKGRIEKKKNVLNKNRPKIVKKSAVELPEKDITIKLESDDNEISVENKAENIPKVLTKNQKKRASKWKKQKAIADGTFVPHQNPTKVKKVPEGPSETQDGEAKIGMTKKQLKMAWKQRIVEKRKLKKAKRSGNAISKDVADDKPLSPSDKETQEGEAKNGMSRKELKMAWKQSILEKRELKMAKKKGNATSDETPLPPVDKDFLNRQKAYLEQLEMKNSTSELPQKIKRKLFYLKKTLREKGLSQAAIKEIIKKESKHEEEKFMKSVPTKPCFNCRQMGHRQANCPQKVDDSNSCYKCGATNHTSSTCKKNIRGYPLAKCFICKEQGHISRDCPKNEHGLYVKGGRCSLCGNVNHLQKDCPSRKSKKREDNGITLGTLMDGKSIDEEVLENRPTKFKKKPNKPKVVKF